MKNKRVIPQRPSEDAPLTFCDVAACFSEDEWKLLRHWQKELYSNVMKEIHQALTSLGPLIANSVFSLRPKEKEYVCAANFQDLDPKGRINPFSSDTTAEADMFHKGNEYLEDTQDTDRRQRHDVPRKGFTDITPGKQFSIKREDELISVEHLHPDRKENITSDARFPILSTDADEGLGKFQSPDREDSSICLNSGFSFLSNDADLGNSQCPDRQDSTIYLNSEQEVATSTASIGINEEGETYTITIQDCQKSPSGNGSVPRKRNIVHSDRYKNRPRLYNSALKGVKENVIQSTYETQDSVNEMKLGSDQELIIVNNQQWQSGCNPQAIPNLHLMAPNVQGSDPNNTCENTVRNDNIFPCKSIQQRSYKPYVWTKSEQTCQDISPIRQTVAREVKAIYTCNECGKTFSAMSKLITHERIHTGERPYHCTVCTKSFSQPGTLHRHQILHTGEKPYQCGVCGKNFNLKHNLVGHQKTHTKVE